MGLGNIIDKMILLAAINRLHSATCLCLLEARIWISNVICHGFYLMFNCLRTEVVVCFVDIGGIVDYD